MWKCTELGGQHISGSLPWWHLGLEQKALRGLRADVPVPLTPSRVWGAPARAFSFLLAQCSRTACVWVLKGVALSLIGLWKCCSAGRPVLCAAQRADEKYWFGKNFHHLRCCLKRGNIEIETAGASCCLSPAHS